MKKILCLPLLAGIIFSSCNKEKPSPVNPSNTATASAQQQPTLSRALNQEGITYTLYGPDGSPLADDYQVDMENGVCYAKQIDTLNVEVHYFDNELQFRDYIMTQPNDSAQVLQKMRAKDLLMSYPDIDQEIAATDNGGEPSDAFLNWFNTHFPETSQKSAATGALWEHDCFGGSAFPAGPTPFWSFWSFRNKASSANFVGMLALYDGTWWRGRSIWIFQKLPHTGSPCPPISSGAVRAPFFSLGWTMGFNDMAESSL